MQLPFNKHLHFCTPVSAPGFYTANRFISTAWVAGRDHRQRKGSDSFLSYVTSVLRIE